MVRPLSASKRNLRSTGKKITTEDYNPAELTNDEEDRAFLSLMNRLNAALAEPKARIFAQEKKQHEKFERFVLELDYKLGETTASLRTKYMGNSRFRTIGPSF